jgi:hypothetical protein
MKDYKLIIRASSVSDFLKSGRSKSEEFGETAISLIKSIAIKDVFGLVKSVSAKEMDKGTMLEAESIEMLNGMLFASYFKNEVRVTQNGFSGECDIDSESESLIIDMKNSWSASSFAWTKDELVSKCKKAGYEEQLRTYMMLYNRDHAKLVDVLQTTPMELLPPYEDYDYHDVDHIQIQKRITIIDFERDKEWEERLLERYAKAELIYNEFINQLISK